jgi:TRAP transporter 4TM/12TM fusion protein
MESTEPSVTRIRSLKGWCRTLARIQLVAIPVVGTFFILDIPFHLGMAILMEQYFGIFFALLLGSLFLIYPVRRRPTDGRVPWYDLILTLLSFIVGLYIAILYPKVLFELGVVTPDKVILGTIAIFLILEGIRRVTGWILVVLGLLFLVYGRFTWLFPGIFKGPGITWDLLSIYLFLDPTAILGLPMDVTAVIILAFIIFGNLLAGIGGGTLFTDVAVAGFGRFRGGPAKIAVVASSLFGTISGSAVANVMVDGWITIPLMKKTGYKAHVASAIEAVASTGGQIMPPVMGVTAFIMAEFTGIPYSQIAISALLPSLLYYLALFIQVDLEAGKNGLHGLPSNQLPRLKDVLMRSWLILIPLAVLVYTLFILYLTPGKSALLSAFSILLLGFFRRETRFRGKWILEALEGTGAALLEVGPIVALAGIIIGVVNYTGLGSILSSSIVQLSGGNVYSLLFIIAVVGMILGMGMPTAPVYIILAVLLGPALIQLGISVMAAHLFIQYMGMLSLFTPPVAFAAFAAAAIGGTSGMRTGYSAMRLGVIVYIVPFVFVFSPALLMMDAPEKIVAAMITSSFGCFMVGTALTGYLFRELSVTKRILMAVASLCLFIPLQKPVSAVGILGNIAGAVLGLALLFFEWRGKQGSDQELKRPLQNDQLAMTR